MHNENKSKKKKVNSPCQRRKLEIGFFSFSHTCRKTIAQHTHWKKKKKEKKREKFNEKRKKERKILKVGLVVEKEVEKRFFSISTPKKKMKDGILILNKTRQNWKKTLRVHNKEVTKTTGRG
jgi:hypothetical protein